MSVAQREVADCFRIAVRGGPKREPIRGLTLQLATEHHDHILRSLGNINLLVESQIDLVERAKKAYGDGSNGLIFQQRLLQQLLDIQSNQSLSRQAIAHQVLDVLINLDI